MSLSSLAPNTLVIVVAFVYDTENAPALRLLGRVGIALAEHAIVLRACLAHADLWARRDELLGDLSWAEPGRAESPQRQDYDVLSDWSDWSYESWGS